MSTCQELLGNIRHEIDKLYQIEQVDDYCLLVTPFLNADAAPVEIWIEQNNDSVRLFDDGETLNYLFVNGLALESNPDLMYQAELMANIHSVQLVDSILSTTVSLSQVGDAVHRLASSMQAISYLLYKRSHRPKTDFATEVQSLLATNSIAYEARYTVQGNANTHQIDFYINSGRNMLIETLSATTQSNARQRAKLIAYEWMDIGRVFRDQYKYGVVLDDQGESKRRLWQDRETISTLQSYSTHIFRWSDEKGVLLDTLR